jgi:hypothetical protein
MVTTIKLKEQTKKELDTFREYKNETYDELVRKVLYIAKNIMKNPQLSKKTIREIEEARKRIREDNFYTEEEVRDQNKDIGEITLEGKPSNAPNHMNCSKRTFLTSPHYPKR